MPTYTEPKHLGDVLLVEVKEGWTKQKGMLAVTTVSLGIGVVLAQLANGEYAPVNFETGLGAAAVLITNANPSDKAESVVLIKRGAVVAKNELIWPVGTTNEQIEVALSQLEALGIVAQNAY